ncbi:hypothetical protein DFJ63DRAFT_22439 [Scheffersomyces coipomensis]|uniref:uncharacterized protein n=1 Tax=Scheffersomyces coipomensis TaxID=1788519 RepID=UPI00315DAC81
MKLSGLHLLASALAITEGVFAFSDTASFYSSIKLNGQLDYITEASIVSNSIQSLSETICGSQSDEKLFIYRVKALSHDNVSSIPSSSSFIKHVHYNSPNEIDFEFGSSCNKDSVKYINGVDGDIADSRIVIFDVEDDKHHSIDDFLNTQNENIKVIVQGKPKFQSKFPKLKHLEHLIEDKLYEHLNLDIDFKGKKDASKTKRDEIADEENYDDIYAEVEEDFKAAESFIAEEGDSIVSIFDESGADDVSASNVIAQAGTGGLFAKYQFFSPGIWSAIIISFVLVFILYTAVGWLSAIEISYYSFEKQVDYEKKNE